MKDKLLKGKIQQKLITLAILAGTVILLSVTGIGCLNRFLFGFPCPGCGITRACMAALRGDFIEALRWHPLFWIAVPGILYIFLGEKPLFGKEKIETIFIVAIALSLLLVWIIRIFWAEYFGLFNIDGGTGFMVKLVKQIFCEVF
ncbi:MAG: DUF2752 domain-containing protein [Ruminococcaceae bacterium]|nr:DUF2752 domain-containing protein [Oscillospiraceae bacterium]